MAKLRENTTIIFGGLGEKLNGYQQEKLSQMKLLKQLLKVLSKYWQLANNTEIVYNIMDNISGNLKYEVLLAGSEISEADRALYDQAMEIFAQDRQYIQDWKKYLADKEELDAIEQSYVESGKVLPASLQEQKDALEEEKTRLEELHADLESQKEEISERCIEKLGEILNEIESIKAHIKSNSFTSDEYIKYKYFLKWNKHKEYLLKLNNLGVDIRLTTDILKADIEKIKEIIAKLQEVIDSFAGGPVNPLVGKFNKRLKQFTKRLLEIVNYINDNYPEIEFELNGSEDENNMSGEIFSNDIITSDKGIATDRHFYDIDNENDGVDQDDVDLLKKIIKLMAKNKISNEDKEKLVAALDTNGDGVLDNADLEWLQSYVQDQEEIEHFAETDPSKLEPYKETEIDEEAQQVIDKVTSPDFKGEPYIYEGEPTPQVPVNNNSGDIYNEPFNIYTAAEAAAYNAQLDGAISINNWKVEPVEGVDGEHYSQEEIDAAQEGDDAYGKSVEDWKVEPVEAVEGVHYTQEEVDAYNAQLDGAVSEGEHKK